MQPRIPTTIVCSVLLAVAIAACGSSSGNGGSSSNGVASGNGVASKSPTAIVAAATQAIDGVHSVHVSGSTSSAGASIDLDLDLVAGQGGRGQMSIGGASFQIVSVDKVVYIKAGSVFWSRFASQQAARLLHGKWLRAPASGRFASFASLTNLTELFNQLLSRHGTLAKGASTTVNGQQAIAIEDKTKGGTLYVATTGKPYPLEIAKGGSQGGSVVFDQINQPVSLTAPSSSIAIPQ